MAVSYFDPKAGSSAVRKEALASSRRAGVAGRKCESCGSLEYVSHHGASICSYCRTPAEGAAAPSHSRADQFDRLALADQWEGNGRSSAGENAAGYAALVASLWGS